MKDLSASHSLGNLTYKAFNIIPVAGHMKALIPKLTHTLKTHNYVLDKKKKKNQTIWDFGEYSSSFRLKCSMFARWKVYWCSSSDRYPSVYRVGGKFLQPWRTVIISTDFHPMGLTCYMVVPGYQYSSGNSSWLFHSTIKVHAHGWVRLKVYQCAKGAFYKEQMWSSINSLIFAGSNQRFKKGKRNINL